ncbi:MAG TPA: MbtH family protein [Janthinobacterium sp.]|nr:MbtH family protein [Janthinobacterium sp.]
MQQEQLYEVVINAQRQYSLWPAQRPVPGGWQATGFCDSRAQCLEHIGVVWRDLREHDAQAALADAGVQHG